MPRIPYSLAGGEIPGRIPLMSNPSPGVWGLPGRAIQGAADVLEEANSQWGVVRSKLQSERDEMEAISLVADYDMQIGALKNEIKRNPDPLQHEQLFARGAQSIAEEVTKRTQSEVVQKIINKHVMREFPKSIAGIRTESMSLFDGQQRAWLEKQEDYLSQKAAEAPTEQERSEAVNTFQGLVTRAEQRALITPERAEIHRQQFRDKAIEKQMDVIRRTDRTRLFEMDRQGAFSLLDPVKRLRILEQARKDIEHEERQTEKNFNIAKEAVELDWSARANFGLLNAAEIEAAKSGRNGFISPTRARELEHINESAASTEADQQVAAIMQEYRLGETSFNRITNARVQLQRLSTTLGKPSKSLSKAADELQTDERSLRGITAQETMAKQKDAMDTFTSQKPSVPMPGIIGQIQKNRDEADKAKIRMRVRSGQDPKAAVDSVLKERKAEADALPERDKTILNLVE